MSQAAPGAPRNKFFYGWWMVWLGGFLSSLDKTAVNTGSPVFVAPVRDGFGASNAAVSFIFSLARAESGPTGPIAGWFIDRFGPPRPLGPGAPDGRRLPGVLPKNTACTTGGGVSPHGTEELEPWNARKRLISRKSC